MQVPFCAPLLALTAGGGRGIGRAVCQRLAAENASVIVADKQAAQAEQVAEEIRQQGGSANSVQVGSDVHMLSLIASSICFGVCYVISMPCLELLILVSGWSPFIV